MHLLQRILRVQIVRNLLGAAGGIAIALVVYGAYDFGTDVIVSISPVEHNRAFVDSSVQTNSEAFKKFAEKADELKAKMSDQ